MTVDSPDEPRSLALTPTWSVATVLTVFVVLSLIVERSIHHLSRWLHKTKRKPLFEAVEKMKSELMLLGFLSLMLSATSSLILNQSSMTPSSLHVRDPLLKKVIQIYFMRLDPMVVNC